MDWTEKRIEAFLEQGPDPTRWARRRLEITKAIDRYAWELESVSTLFLLLGCEPRELDSTTADWRRTINKGRELTAFIDGSLSQEPDRPTERADLQLTTRLCKAWLLLEIGFQPDDRCSLTDLRDRLVREADRREIDLRGTGV